MASKNYTDYEGGGNWHGTQIEGIDQKATQAFERCDANREAFGAGGAYTPCSEAEYRAMRIVDKRKQRGGATFNVGDAF